MSDDKQTYLDMQKQFYNNEAQGWSLENKNPVVGSYDQHNQWEDYDKYLFKDFDTSNLIALEYGCGPARNIIKFNDRFARIDGVDISENVIGKAAYNLSIEGIIGSNLKSCNGESIPFEDSSYDVVFSVICLQHICCHEIRFAIMKDVYRVLKSGGHFCFQMGFGAGKDASVVYTENNYYAKGTNGMFDVNISDEKFLQEDLEKIGFKNFKFDIRPVGPGDAHQNWIFVQVEK